MKDFPTALALIQQGPKSTIGPFEDLDYQTATMVIDIIWSINNNKTIRRMDDMVKHGEKTTWYAVSPSRF